MELFLNIASLVTSPDHPMPEDAIDVEFQIKPIVPPVPTRVLTLHGKGDNSEVVERQLSNLCLEGLELISAQGPLTLAADPSMELFVDGPFFAWYDLGQEDAARQVLTALAGLLNFIDSHGPFYGVASNPCPIMRVCVSPSID